MCKGMQSKKVNKNADSNPSPLHSEGVQEVCKGCAKSSAKPPEEGQEWREVINTIILSWLESVQETPVFVIQWIMEIDWRKWIIAIAPIVGFFAKLSALLGSVYFVGVVICEIASKVGKSVSVAFKSLEQSKALDYLLIGAVVCLLIIIVLFVKRQANQSIRFTDWDNDKPEQQEVQESTSVVHNHYY